MLSIFYDSVDNFMKKEFRIQGNKFLGFWYRKSALKVVAQEAVIK